jgi:NitT/TauT family transport system ATP-binding protein
MIGVRDLKKTYNQALLYENFNLIFDEGKITALLGPSGCGKTTLLKILAGIEPFEKGEILGVKRVSFLFQEDRLLPHRTLYDNIDWVLRATHDKVTRQIIVEELVDFLQLGDYLYAKIETLSGGMKRRVALGRALAYPSPLLLMDEPFKGLDPKLKEELLIKLKTRWAQNHQTVIFVTHDKEEAYRLSHAIYQLQGRPVCAEKI